MRIDRLDLTAYGPFTDRTLDLSSPGVHLVIGANEAGKSTTLAAIGDALFGIPLKSPAAFVHALKDLRLGMLLRRSDGQVLEFDRLKKNADTIRRPDGSVIPDEEFNRFLGAVHRELFSTMYGIDSDRLRKGGQDLLAGRGELGQALLGAGTGTVDLPAALSQLANRADALFAPRAQKPKLNEAISRHKDLVEKAREYSLRPSEFAEARHQIEQLKQRRDQTKQRRYGIADERDECQLLLGLFDRIARRRTALDELSELAPTTTRLRDDLGDEFDGLRGELADLRSAELRSKNQLAAIDSQIAALPSDPEVLDHQGEIRALDQELAKYQSCVESLPGLRDQRLEAARSTRKRLTRLGLDLGIEEARPALTTSIIDEERVASLAEAESTLRATENSARKLLTSTQSELDSQQGKLAAHPVVADRGQLSASVRALQAQEDLTARHAALSAILHACSAELATSLAQMGLGSLPPGEFLELGVPGRATLNRLRGRHDDLISIAKALDSQRVDTEQAISRLTEQLQELLSRSEIPSPADLLRSRERRDGQWTHIRSALLGDGTPRPDSEDPTSLADSYQSAVSDSDELADKLRNEADAVATRARLEADLVAANEKAAATLADIEALNHQVTEFDLEWTATWSPTGIHPEAPGAMSEWLDEHAKARPVASKALQAQLDLDDVATRIADQRAELRHVLASVGVKTPPELTLPTLLQQATTTLRELDEQDAQRLSLEQSVQNLEEQLQTRQAEHHEAVVELDSWQEEWRRAGTALGFSGLTPTEARAHFAESAKLLTELDNIDRIDTEIAALEASKSGFEARLTQVAESLEMSGLGRGPESVLARLSDRLQSASENRIKLQQLSANRSGLAEQLMEEQALRQAAEDRLDQLLNEASVDSEGELHAAIEESDRLRRVEATVQHLNEELATQSGGRSPDELEQALGGSDAAKLKLVVEERDSELDEIDADLEEVNRQLGERTAERNRWDGSSKAADAANEVQLVLSEIGTLTEEYLSVQMAVELLRDYITLFREKNQGPILKRATPWFEQMTCGSFKRLEASHGSADAVVLEAVRPDGAALTVDQLSEGTRDQLYLALRLAALAENAVAGEPYPLVLDDLLMTFDETRSRAALEVLGELSATTQVLLFTHHRHVGEIAHSVLGSTLTCHDL